MKTKQVKLINLNVTYQETIHGFTFVSDKISKCNVTKINVSYTVMFGSLKTVVGNYIPIEFIEN